MDYRKQKPVTLSAAAMGYQNALENNGSGKPLTATEQYNAGRNIYANKVGYMNQHNAGNYGAAEGFRTVASPYYSALEKGGAKDVADTFHSSDVSTSRKVLSDLGFNAYAENYRNNSNKVIDNTLKKANLEYDNQKNAVNDSYDALARQGYLNYMEAKKGMPQQLKAQGMTGGLSESSQIALKNNYGQQVSENQRARLQALSELDTAKTGAMLDAENQKLGIESDLASKEYERLLTELGYDFQAGETDKQIAAQRDLQADQQQWQSGENRKSEAHDLLYQGNQFEHDDKTLSSQQAHDKDILASEQAHDSSENEKTRQFNAALTLADAGSFRALAELTGYPVEEVEKNYKNKLWLEHAYQQYAEYMFPGQSHMYYYTGGTGGTSKQPGNAPDLTGFY